MSEAIVIAGAGLAAQRCAETLRRQGHDGPLRIVGAEAHAPYDRPPLSKELLAGAREPARLRLRDDAWYADHDVELLLGAAAVGLDPATRRLQLAGGAKVPYDRLVVATGAAPRMLPVLRDVPGILTLRDLDDALALRRHLRPGSRLAIVGAGFIGLEVAATARALGTEVVVVEAAPTPLAAVVGEDVGGWFARWHAEEGVRLHTGRCVTGARSGAGEVELALDDGATLAADAVLVAVGAAPDTRWLRAAGLPGDGIPVGPGGASAVPRIHVAGDAARPLDPRTGVPRRREHWEAAARSGAAVARSLLGRAPAGDLPEGFWSDQHGIRIQLVGERDGATHLTVDGDPARRNVTATWWRGERAVAVLLAGRPEALPAARRLVAGVDPIEHPGTERTAA